MDLASSGALNQRADPEEPVHARDQPGESMHLNFPQIHCMEQSEQSAHTQMESGRSELPGEG